MMMGAKGPKMKEMIRTTRILRGYFSFLQLQIFNSFSDESDDNIMNDTWPRIIAVKKIAF